jgi:pimeloyl-ACP methyl ester carboxylesterase
LGWSDAGPEPRTGRQIAAELHNLLLAAGETGPYVMAGYSLGGLYVREFASLYPDEVTGMVLLDGSHEDQFELLPEQAGSARIVTAALRGAAVLARFGVLRALAPLAQSLPPIAPLPGEMRRHLPVVANSQAIASALAETDALPATQAQVRAARAEGRPWGFPLVVLTAGQMRPDLASAWPGLQQDLLTLSTDSRQRFAPQSSHDTLLFAEPPLVVDAILEAVRAARPG